MVADNIRLTHVLIFVSNLSRSREFYVEAVGLQIVVEEADYLRLKGLGVDLGLHHAYEPEQVGGAGIELQLSGR